METIVTEYHGLKSEISRIKQGYDFAAELMQDVKVRSRLILTEQDDQFTNLGLVLQLAEYQFAWDDIRHKVGNPYSVGIALYGIVHWKAHNFLDGMYNDLVKKRNDLSTI